VIKQLNSAGLTVCVENFYTGKDETSFLKNCSAFNALFPVCCRNGLDVLPVADLGRLFIEDYVHTYDAMLLTKMMLSTFAAFDYPVIYHIIDFLDYHQSRDSWCTLGIGLLPSRQIFDFAKTIGLSIDHVVFEYEKKQMCMESIAAIPSFF
jgi:hypothetical protein